MMRQKEEEEEREAMAMRMLVIKLVGAQLVTQGMIIVYRY